jgi:c-di-GMP-binding flagellar brake protein YcgR
MGEEENRVHARIHVSTKIDVASSDGAGIVECELKDLSKGGARFFAEKSVGQIGETIELFLPALDGGDIAVMAQIIRNELAGDGRMVAVRFDAVEPSMQRALSDLLELLLSSTGAGTRKHPRVARRIEIRFGLLGELRGILEDISQGGLLMTIADPLSLFEEVDVIVPDLAGQELLTLHARVTHQRKVIKPESASYQVGLEFSAMRPEAQACVLALLRSVLDVLEPEQLASPEEMEEAKAEGGATEIADAKSEVAEAKSEPPEAKDDVTGGP